MALVVACSVFWIGLPLGCLWALGEVTDARTTHLVAAIVGVPIAMALDSPVLFWLNGRYLQVAGVVQQQAEDEDEAAWRRRVRGPLEPILLGSFLIELTALFVWFFIFAENPSPSIL